MTPLAEVDRLLRQPERPRRRRRTSTTTSCGGGPGSTATRSSSWRPTWTFRARIDQPASTSRCATSASASSPARCAAVRRPRRSAWSPIRGSSQTALIRRSPGAHCVRVVCPAETSNGGIGCRLSSTLLSRVSQQASREGPPGDVRARSPSTFADWRLDVNVPDKARLEPPDVDERGPGDRPTPHQRTPSPPRRRRRRARIGRRPSLRAVGAAARSSHPGPAVRARAATNLAPTRSRSDRCCRRPRPQRACLPGRRSRSATPAMRACSTGSIASSHLDPPAGTGSSIPGPGDLRA